MPLRVPPKWEATCFVHWYGVPKAQVQPTAPTPAAPTPAQPAAAPGTPVKLSLKSGTPFLGNANAKVTVVEYADYQCPFCEKFYTTVMNELKTKFMKQLFEYGG